MNLARAVEPELLDEITLDDPRAIRARNDLRRVNSIMGHTIIWKRMLREMISVSQPNMNIVELGAGDGTLLIRLLPSQANQWPHARLLLIDRHPAVSNKTLDTYTAQGWQAACVETDIFDWIYTMPKIDLVICNLVLHHFNDVQLQKLFQHLAGNTAMFAACEPRRSQLALLGSNLLGLIGCGPVARYDAVVSVRAGFSGTELSRLWPENENWRLQESKAGLFSHVFIAKKSGTDAQVQR